MLGGLARYWGWGPRGDSHEEVGLGGGEGAPGAQKEEGHRFQMQRSRGCGT